jgi:DNA-binding PadR family transcriptional regulator
MMSKYEILKAISLREPATLQSIYGELKDEDKNKEADAGSLIEELVSLVSEGLIEEHEEDTGVTYVLTASGKKELEALGE